MKSKWRKIIENWINCYFVENENKDQTLTIEVLLNIISHLRENLNLDESKSSSLEAHSVDEFILEKYPEFRFENGTVEANTEEDLYMAASLLLLFVCVNSKDIDMKNAMCRELNVDDQEVILKFNRFLLDCSPIKFSDVKTAIIDACGPAIAVTDLERSGPSVVSETPPALRSLHGEARRLQAALDAERFDRNYLQEELSRTNLKLEKLMKCNEEYKQDIIRLKAQISMCCSHDNNVKTNDEAVQGTAKLLKDIQIIEERLVDTQGNLEDALYERDSYKTKVIDLKQERDKWLLLSQQQTDLVNQLTEELEGERQTTHSLRELVAELRQHNQLTRMDSSHIECDDPNASIHSFQQNTSFCSEACANVIEVQLGEERAKIEMLKQQIQSLQEQLQEMSQKHDIEKLSLKKIISDKEDDIFNLKHRINEEIEINNNMTVHYSDSFIKLNNDVNELEQKLKDANIQSRLVIEMKMQEIQTLQEEKLSLLQSLNDETTKLDGIIKKLESELAYERNSIAQQKKDYENHIMTLNVKVLNRNNELVELQNNVFEKSEQIEVLHTEIRNEKHTRQKILKEHNNELEVLNKRLLDTENILQQKQSEIEILNTRLKENSIHNEKLNSELKLLRDSDIKLKQACRDFEENKIVLLNEIENEKQLNEKITQQHHNDLEEVKKDATMKREEVSKLKEEIVIFEQQIQSWQDKYSNLSQKSESEKLTLEAIISEKDNKLEFELLNRQIEVKHLIQERDELMHKHQEQLEIFAKSKLDADNNLQEKSVELEMLNDRLEQNSINNQKLNCELEILRNSFMDMQKAYSDLEESKITLFNELENEKQTREKIMQQHRNEMELLNNRKLETENKLQEKQLEVEMLNDRLKQNSNDIEKLKNYLDISKNSVIKLKDACNDLEETKIKLANEIVDKDNLLLEYYEEIDDLKNKYSHEKENCQKRKDELESKFAKLSEEAHRAREDATMKSVDISKLREDVLVFKQQTQLWQDKYDSLSRKNESEKLALEYIISRKDKIIENELSKETEVKYLIQEKDELIRKHQEELQILEKRMLESDSSAQQKQAEIKMFNEKIKQISINNQELNNELKILIQSTTDLKQSCSDLEACKIILINNIENEKQRRGMIMQQHRIELEQLNSKRLDTEHNLQQKESEVEILNDRLKQNSYDNAKLLNELEILRKSVTDLKQSCSDMEENKIILLKKIEDENQSREKIMQHIYNELEQLNRRILDAENKLQQKELEVIMLKDSMNQNCCDTEKINNELYILRNSEIKLKEAFRELEETKISLVNEIVEKDNKLLENFKEIEDLKNRHSQVKDNCQKEKNEYESKIALFSEEAHRAREDAIIKDMDLTKLREDIIVFEQQIQSWEDKYNSLSQKSASEKLVLENISQKNEKLEMQLIHKDEEIKCLMKERDELMNKYQEELETLDKRKLDADSNVQQKQAEIEKLISRLNEMDTRNKELYSELEQIKVSVVQLTNSCKNLEEDKMLLLKEIANKDNKIVEQTKEIDDLKIKLITEKEIFDKQRVKYESRIAIMTDEMSKTREDPAIRLENEKLNNDLDNLRKSMFDLNKAYCNLEENKLELLKEIENEKKAKEKMIQQHHNELELLNKKKLEIDKDLVQKQSEIEVLNDKLKQNFNNNEKLNNELQILRNTLMKMKQTSDYEKNKIVLTNEIADIDSKLLDQHKELYDMKNKYSQDIESYGKRKEKYELKNAREDTAMSSERVRSGKHSGTSEKDFRDRDFHQQVDYTTSDLTHSSIDSNKTITDLEKIICNKNRTITILQTDITYLKTIIADSENKILDYTKELELSNENNQQLSSQLKKIVSQKNEEIAELKRQITKMSATENRVSQIIRVSAKYQAIILKRIAEIKSNTVLKELTNFGNSNGDNELRRSLNAGAITMEDLENFLETTDKHLRRCSEKQMILQKERDRLSEVNRINESEIINMRKFLTELSVSFQTFNSIKDLYTQKLTRVVTMQRTVRRELLNLDGRVSDTSMFKLERGYGAVMQDLAECVMNMERWVERSIGRKISSEKIKQAFMSDDDRSSLASTTFQNTSLEVQLEELENSFKKLLEEILRAQRDGNAKDPQSTTIMELRVEYEDKLNRMKAKMKELYKEQIESCMAKQKKVIDSLERELAETREKLKVTSKAYEDHIRGLATDLWNVSEKFLATKDELGWLQKKQRSGSLMSLQHLHSSGLLPRNDEQPRISDASSLRSLPVHNESKREGRGLHMSDEEGEVFDKPFSTRTATYSAKRRPASSADVTGVGGRGGRGGRAAAAQGGGHHGLQEARPAHAQQAGRPPLRHGQHRHHHHHHHAIPLDSELRESLRLEPEANVTRKTSTPSRLRSLFRSNKSESVDGTPRSRRMSIFRKK
ncbi:hypothetical protein ACJJTC_001151 [Scirpophaga incertulas]